MAPTGTQRRIDWRVVGITTIAGLCIVAGGLAVDGFSRATLAGALINIGVAVGLFAVLWTLEQRIVRSVSNAARDGVRQANAELEKRVVRLETLDTQQQDERKARRDRADSQIDALVHGEVSRQAIGELLVAADAEGLFDPYVAVRTSADPDCHLLHFLPLVTPGGTDILWISFDPLVRGPDIRLDDGTVVPAPNSNATTIMWIHDQDAAQIAIDLEANLKKRNEPLRGFNFKYAILRLAETVGQARASRDTDSEAVRLHGSLRLLINKEWAVTGFGLESLVRPIAFRMHWAGLRGGRSGSAAWYPNAIEVDESLVDPGDPMWVEALRWTLDYYTPEFLSPGAEPTHPVASMVGKWSAEGWDPRSNL